MLPEEPTPTNSPPVFGSIARWRLAWPMDDAEHALLGQHLFADDGRGGLALLGRHVRDLGVAGARARTHGAETMRHLPDAVLVGDQNLAVAPGQAIGAVQSFDVAIDPVRLAVAVVVAKQRDVADLLLGHEHVAVRQHQEPPRMLKPGGEGGRGEAFRHARHLAGVGQRHRAARRDRAGLRRRQVLGLDGDAPADLLVGQRRRIVGARPWMAQGCSAPTSAALLPRPEQTPRSPSAVGTTEVSSRSPGPPCF